MLLKSCEKTHQDVIKAAKEELEKLPLLYPWNIVVRHCTLFKQN